MGLIANLFNTLLTYPIFNVLMELYHLLGDFGLSIVVLTTIVFLATFPFTWKQLHWDYHLLRVAIRGWGRSLSPGMAAPEHDPTLLRHRLGITLDRTRTRYKRPR